MTNDSDANVLLTNRGTGSEQSSKGKGDEGSVSQRKKDRGWDGIGKKENRGVTSLRSPWGKGQSGGNDDRFSTHCARGLTVGVHQGRKGDPPGQGRESWFMLREGHWSGGKSGKV